MPHLDNLTAFMKEAFAADKAERPAEPSLAILQVAIRTDDGVIHTMPRPARHGEIIGALWRLYPAPTGHSASNFGEHGFMLTDGAFANRAEAWKIAEARGQILPDARKRDFPYLLLFTEDVW